MQLDQESMVDKDVSLLKGTLHKLSKQCIALSKPKVGHNNCYKPLHKKTSELVRMKQRAWTRYWETRLMDKWKEYTKKEPSQYVAKIFEELKGKASFI